MVHIGQEDAHDDGPMESCPCRFQGRLYVAETSPIIPLVGLTRNGIIKARCGGPTTKDFDAFDLEHSHQVSLEIVTVEYHSVGPHLGGLIKTIGDYQVQQLVHIGKWQGLGMVDGHRIEISH